jgi:23S rRNA (adenine2503-C2)-methyltransferase
MRIESKTDPATNTVWKAEPNGYYEVRYADKMAYEVIYLSAQSGCNQGCRFCHLTTSGQTSYVNAKRDDIYKQALCGLEQCRDHSDDLGLVHYNWMARGEPLNNPTVNSDTLFILSEMAMQKGMRARHLISTIIPRDFCIRAEFVDRFYHLQPEIYWSLYTVDEDKRKHFMPNAAPVPAAVEKLLRWQEHSRKVIKVHFSVVPNLNDSKEDIEQLAYLLHGTGLRTDFNLIEFNAPEGVDAKPALSVEEARDIILSIMPKPTQVFIIPRIAPDAYVSCGMFFDGQA